MRKTPSEAKLPARTPLELAVMLLLARAQRQGVYRYLALRAKKQRRRKEEIKAWNMYYMEQDAIGEGLRELNTLKG